MLRKRLTAFLLSFALLLALLPVIPASAGSAVFNGVYYSDDYTTWRQTDKAWKDLPLGKSSTTMGKSGCLVASLAILMCRTNCYSTTQLNPGSLLLWLNEKGYFTSEGGLYYGNLTDSTCPRFVYSAQGTCKAAEGMETNLSYARQTIESLQKQGYAIIVEVNSPTGRSQHFVAVNYPYGDNDVSICDPGSGHALLSKYKEYRRFLCFKPNPSATDKIFNGADAPPVTPTPDTPTPDTPTPVTPTPVTPTPGTSGVSVTITYDNNWINIGKNTQPALSGDHYNLITPYRDDAAFLGWYLDGALVTNSSTVPDRNHTLVARWDPKGFGYSAGPSYDGRFTDVNPSEWYYSDMMRAFSYNLMNGTTDTTFEPDAKIPYFQAITIAARVNKQYQDGNTSFGTTKPWYMAPAGYAYEQKIIDEWPEDFEAYITRWEFANMLSKAVPTSALPEVNSIAVGAIPDVYNSDKEIYRLYRAGVIRGNDEQGSFLPDKTITRAEAAALLVRLVDPNSRTLFSLW